MTPIDKLKSVLCDPEGKCCIHGSDEDRRIVDEAITALQAEVERLARVNAELVEALNDIVYGLEKSRIWGGMDWTYNPIHPVNYLPLRDKARAALAKATGETK